jgi:hypothetical protein
MPSCLVVVACSGCKKIHANACTSLRNAAGKQLNYLSPDLDYPPVDVIEPSFLHAVFTHINYAEQVYCCYLQSVTLGNNENGHKIILLEEKLTRENFKESANQGMLKRRYPINKFFVDAFRKLGFIVDRFEGSLYPDI